MIAGSNLTYTIKVTNLGPSDNSGFTLSDALPAGTSFVSATSPDCVHSAGTVTCTSAGLAAGADVTWTIVASVASSVADGTTLSNSASIATNNTTDPVAGNNSDTETTAVIARADLQVEKSDSPDPVIAGSNLTYTIKVTNLGPSDNSGFTLSDALPAGTSFVSATSPDCVHSAGTVTCTSAGLAAGADVTWTIVASVASSVADGTTLSNSASIATNNTTDPVAVNNSDTETTAVIARADLSITKDDSVDPVTAGRRAYLQHHSQQCRTFRRPGSYRQRHAPGTAHRSFGQLFAGQLHQLPLQPRHNRRRRQCHHHGHGHR